MPTNWSIPAPRTSQHPYLAHVAWAALGVVAAVSGWYAWSGPGAFGLFAAIGGAFAMWRWLGPRGSWMAMITMGLLMSGVLGWQAATGSRCPADGTKVYLKLDKPPVDCGDIRASAASMAMFFGLIALIGLAAPFYARRPERADELPAG